MGSSQRILVSSLGLEWTAQYTLIYITENLGSRDPLSHSAFNFDGKTRRKNYYALSIFLLMSIQVTIVEMTILIGLN